jgi:CPA2 family monovalent cation:H+ antiporter-2
MSIMGESLYAALGLGLALALSSTALVLPISGTQGRSARGAVDAAVRGHRARSHHLPARRDRPTAAADGGAVLLDTLWRGGLVIVALLLAGRFLLPSLFAQAAQTKSPELFLAASLLVVIVAALATVRSAFRRSWARCSPAC